MMRRERGKRDSLLLTLRTGVQQIQDGLLDSLIQRFLSCCHGTLMSKVSDSVIFLCGKEHKFAIFESSSLIWKIPEKFL
ncbi:hypothetical protein V6N11_024371 [Hibiscus sabdariffa]|uniref:Uncharacterized protein n=1 Tax=Hibiscus sabdariffa TaxID=183260 RepID=A0ABR2NF24_9ROSI